MTTAFYPLFLSVVCVVRNQSAIHRQIITEISAQVSPLVSDYELILVDNASDDSSISELRDLTGEQGLANVQVYALTKEVDADTASWVGLENALGDYVVVVDPLIDEIGFLPQMLDQAVSGADVVFAENAQKMRQGWLYRLAHHSFNRLYQWFSGIHLATDAPQYRLLSKRVVNFILQHPRPSLAYRYLPASGGFAKSNLNYSVAPRGRPVKHLGNSIERGVRLLMSTSRAPMRLVTALCIFGALTNILYSIYVLAIAIFKTDIAPGWVSLSLQQSGMFFLISLVLLVLGEYVLNMASQSNEGPLYHVGQEFTSARMSRQAKLNVEDLTRVPSRKADRPGEVSVTENAGT